VCAEKVPWADHGSRFTRDFEEMAAYLAQVTDRTNASAMLGIAWQTIGRIIERVVSRRLDPGRLDGLRRIGVDEFSYRKRHRYLTVVVDHDRGRVVWASEGHGAEALRRFFEALGPQRLAQLETATIDMAAGYIKAFEDHAPHVQIAFDRFHVQRLVSDALDEVRRDLWRAAQGTEFGQAIKGSRYALLKRRWNLNRTEGQKLAAVQQTNQKLYRAYLLKETLVQALDYRQPWRAKVHLSRWLAWAARSRLPPFIKAARTIRKYRDRVLAYIVHRLTNGVVEGINNRLRTISRRAYGFHSARPLIAMLFLCCGGILLDPPVPGLLP